MLFVPNEAMLTPAGRARLGSIARDVLESGGVLRISSQGTDPGTARFDGWDLASARLGAVARALIQAGFPANRVRIEGPDSDFVQGGKAQTLMIRSEPAPR
jgi:flagellar motor protein MotB